MQSYNAPIIEDLRFWGGNSTSVPFTLPYAVANTSKVLFAVAVERGMTPILELNSVDNSANFSLVDGSRASTLEVFSENTDTLPGGLYVYEIRAENSADQREKTAMTGQFLLIAPVAVND